GPEPGASGTCRERLPRPPLRLRTPTPSGSGQGRASFRSIPRVGRRSAQGDSRARPSCRAWHLVHFRARGGGVARRRGVRAWFLSTRRAGGTAFDQPTHPFSDRRERRGNARDGADESVVLLTHPHCPSAGTG